MPSIEFVLRVALALRKERMLSTFVPLSNVSCEIARCGAQPVEVVHVAAEGLGPGAGKGLGARVRTVRPTT
jgi:hypothetical protein